MNDIAAASPPMRRVRFATVVGTDGSLWGFVSRGCSEGDEFDEELGREFKSWTVLDELEEQSFFLVRQQFDIVMRSTVGGQDVE